jgi:LacI family transcriptional regulator
VTIKDIAKRAKVSISTVSRVLSGRTTVAEDKRQAVLKAVSDLDYRPNIFAQGLAGGQSKTIGVITQDISSPVYDSILRGIRQGLRGSGYSPIFADGYWREDKERQAMDILLQRRVDGLIILGGCSPEETLCQVSKQTNLLVVGRDLPAIADKCLPLDDFGGAYRATTYLIEQGHTKIAHITGLLSHQDAQNRQRGYIQALQDAGLKIDPDLIVEGDFVEQSGVLAVEMLFTRGRLFTAIFAANDQIAIGVRLALYRRGIRVPEDVSIMGFDDQRVAAYLTPPLTTIRQPALEIGETAAQAMLNFLQGKPYELSRFPVELIIRESTARRH